MSTSLHNFVRAALGWPASEYTKLDDVDHEE